ncbi:lipopolysaccharide biosynthesis protein [Ruegeria sp. R13_0]|uniref:GumC family protein n=1 Tax=Ruegeria sp. R13_0 TaxID=2821099 RepID=UPI001ADBD88A|nr:lipopolysaccharide biosynthesis protein [Ruegeria sp. R13_0]MBO9436740.1 lipopolysaccharide biosynthesis protein [Ruegeria sp. R13_0]
MMGEVRFYWALLLRRLPYLLIIVAICTAAGLVLAVTLPPVYRATARLVVESPQIPDDLAATTVQASEVEILQVIEQRLMNRVNLLDLAQKFNVYDGEADMGPDAIVADMRSRISISLPYASPFVSVSFQSFSGQVSAAVTNELVTQILQENVALRTGATSLTLEFFVQEVARLDEELAAQGARILAFKENHKDALPEGLDYRRTRQSSLQERNLQLDRELSGLRDRRTRLVEIYERTGRPDFTGESLTPEQRQLRQLKDQRSAAVVIYSPDHPRVKSLDAQIAALEAANIALGLGTENAPNISAYELQLSDIDGQIDFISEQKTIIQTELNDLAAAIEQTPTNAITLGTLERDYDTLRIQYEQATASLAEARTGDQIEAQSRGRRITVTQQAIAPANPTDPNRKLIAAAGFAGGVGLAFGVFVLLELLNNTIRRPADLVSQLGVQAFGVVPYVQTSGQVALRRILVLCAILAPVLGVCVSLYLIHSHYMPLDLFVEEVGDKLGIDALLSRFGIG